MEEESFEFREALPSMKDGFWGKLECLAGWRKIDKTVAEKILGGTGCPAYCESTQQNKKNQSPNAWRHPLEDMEPVDLDELEREAGPEGL